MMKVSFEWRRIVKVATATFILVVGPSFAAAQGTPDYIGLSKSLAELSGSGYAVANSEGYQAVQKGVNEFEVNLRKAQSNSSDDVVAVSHLKELLHQAAHDPTQGAAIIADVTKDLQIKNGYFGARMGVAGQSRGQIAVTVNTISGAKSASGFIVYCNPYRWAKSTDHVKTFAKLSSPTQATILPGVYRCVASKANGAIAGERMVEIGLDGSDKYDLDIPVTP